MCNNKVKYGNPILSLCDQNSHILFARSFYQGFYHWHFITPWKELENLEKANGERLKTNTLSFNNSGITAIKITKLLYKGYGLNSCLEKPINTVELYIDNIQKCKLARAHQRWTEMEMCCVVWWVRISNCFGHHEDNVSQAKEEKTT